MDNAFLKQLTGTTRKHQVVVIVLTIQLAVGKLTRPSKGVPTNSYCGWRISSSSRNRGRNKESDYP